MHILTRIASTILQKSRKSKVDRTPFSKVAYSCSSNNFHLSQTICLSSRLRFTRIEIFRYITLSNTDKNTRGSRVDRVPVLISLLIRREWRARELRKRKDHLKEGQYRSVRIVNGNCVEIQSELLKATGPHLYVSVTLRNVQLFVQNDTTVVTFYI